MTTADTLVDRGADGLRELSNRAAKHGGMTQKLARPLAEDADFLRKLKPSLMMARAKGELPMDEQPRPVEVPPASRGSRSEKSKSGISPLVIVGAALVTGVLLAKWIDWRGHAHPRD